MEPLKGPQFKVRLQALLSNILLGMEVILLIITQNNFNVLLLEFSKIFGKILDSFKIQKFQTRNIKAMTKDKKVNIAVTNIEV
jgi:hypothetical protein